MTSYERFEFLEIDECHPVTDRLGSTSHARQKADRVEVARELVVEQVIGRYGTAIGEFNCPGGLDVDHNGNLYVVDAYNHRIQRISPDGSIVVIGGKGTAPGRFLNPQDIVVDSEFIYVIEQGNHRIQKISHHGILEMVVGRFGSRPGEFHSPMGMAIDHLGCIYVADTGNSRLQKLSSSGRPLFVVSSVHDRQLYGPQGVDTDSRGNCYVADTFSHCIVKFDSNGREIGRYGCLGTGPGQFNGPQDLAVDRNGMVYIVDMENDRLVVFDDGDECVACFEGNQDTGPLSCPTGIAVGPSGEIYVADTTHHRVLKVAWQ